MTAPCRGVLVDYGGVLTTSPYAAFDACGEAEGLVPGAVSAALAGPLRTAFAALETGELTTRAFEERCVAGLGLPADRAAGLLRRLFARVRSDHATRNAVWALRRAGIRTALLSNSAGTQGYDRGMLAELFDEVVISGEVGLRKPDPEIYLLAARRLDLAPDKLAMVDDLGENLEPAAALGMHTVLHRDAGTTAAALQELTGVTLGIPV